MKTGIVTIVLLAVLLLGGCEALRFAPKESQKQAAELTHFLAKKVNEQGTAPASPASQQLVTGTMAALAYTGRPTTPPDPEQFDTIAAQANQEALERPDPWKVADSVLELGIGISALLGGVYGTRAVRFLQQAREKSKALQEIVIGNELLKENGANFKTAHRAQSPGTKAIVAEIRANNAIPPMSTKA